jgi:hypothetical protein
MDLTVVLLLIYAVTFGAMFILREPAWLAGGGLLACLVVVGHFALGRNATGDAGMGVFVFGMAIAIGFASGAGARLTLLTLGWGESRQRSTAVGLLFLFGVPLALHLWGFAQQRASQRKYAPPSMACKLRLHEMRLGDRMVRVPMIWGMWAETGGGVSDRMHFYQQEQAREFCELAERGDGRLTMLSIDFPQLFDMPNPLLPICQSPRPEAWWKELCRFKRPEYFDLYSIALVDPKRVDMEHRLSISPPAAGPDKAPYGERWIKEGPFMRTGSGYRIYVRGPVRPGAASPYLAHCQETRNDPGRPDGLLCKATYRLTPGVALYYYFRIDGEQFAAEALRHDERVFPIARSLIAEDRKVPSSR